MKEYSEENFRDNAMNKKCLFIGGGLGEDTGDWTLCDQPQKAGIALCEHHHDISYRKDYKRKPKPLFQNWQTGRLTK